MRQRCRRYQWLILLCLVPIWVGVLWVFQPRFVRELSYDLPPIEGLHLYRHDSKPDNLIEADVAGRFTVPGGGHGRLFDSKITLPKMAGPSSHPELTASLVLSDFDNVSLRKIELTHPYFSRRSCSATSEETNAYTITAPVRTWVPGPMTLSVRIYHGQPIDIDAPFNRRLRYLRVDSPLGVYDFRIRSATAANQRPHTRISAPYSASDAIRFTAFTHDGRSIDAKPSVRIPPTYGVTLPVDAGEIDFVRVRFNWDRHEDILFHLQNVRGLPEENRALANRFDTVIRDARFPNARAFEDYIGTMLPVQVESNTPPWAEEDLYFPGGTIRQMLRQYEDLFPGAKVFFNRKEHTLRFENPHASDQWLNTPGGSDL